MPGKVNPVIPEAVTQAALLAIGHDQALTMAVAMGSLELNAFMPLIAHTLLESFDLLTRACAALRARCVDGIEADEARCRRHVENATATRDGARAAHRVRTRVGTGRARRRLGARPEGRGRGRRLRHRRAVRRVHGARSRLPPRASRGRQGRDAVHAQVAAPAHRHLRPPQRRQVVAAQRHHPAAGVDRLRVRRHDDRPGREADGAAAARARCSSSTPPASTTRARSASCGCSGRAPCWTASTSASS